MNLSQDFPLMPQENLLLGDCDILGDDIVLKAIADELLRDISPGTSPNEDSGCRFQDITDPAMALDMALEPIDIPIQSPDYLSYPSPGDSSSIASTSDFSLASPQPIVTFELELPSSPDSTTRLCQVCGKPAGKHNYYGGQACNSCRAFFRRSVQNQTYPKFQCSGDMNCTIDSKSWKSCQWCRFNKCQQCGMKIHWVLNETERKVRAEKREQSRKNRQQLAVKANLMRERAITDKFTLDDEIQVKGLMSASLDYMYREVLKFYTCNWATFEVMLHAVYFGKPVNFDIMRNIELFLNYSMKKFYSDFGDMVDITAQDQAKLVEKNYPPIVEFTQAVYMEASNDDVNKMSIKLTDKLRELSLENQEYKVIEKRFDEVSLNNTRQMQPFKYDQVYSGPWTNDQKIKDQHKEMSFKVHSWPRDGKNSACDEVLITLMAMVMLFSSDGLVLDNGHLVEKIQIKYTNLMYKYLKTKYTSSSTKFCQAMNVTSMSRELRHIRDRYIYKD